LIAGIEDEGVGGVVSKKLLALLLERLTLDVSFAPAPTVIVVMMVVLISSVAMSLQIDQTPSRLLVGEGVVATTKVDDVAEDVPCVIFVMTSCVIAPFMSLEVIVDSSTVPLTSFVGPLAGILVNVV
jgi:hypothetical protein